MQNSNRKARAQRREETDELRSADFRRTVLTEKGITYEKLCEMIKAENERRRKALDVNALKAEIQKRRAGLRGKKVTDISADEELQMELAAYYIKLPTRNVYTICWGTHSDRYPSPAVMALIAKEAGCNVAYLMSLTEISAPIDTHEISFDLARLRNAKGLMKTEFMKNVGISSDLLQRYEMYGLRRYKLNTLLRFCKELDCSIDYLLGLTKYRNWDDLTPEEDPFEGIRGGTPLYIRTSNGKIDGSCILSDDRKLLYFADGTSKSAASKAFKGAFIRQYTL